MRSIIPVITLSILLFSCMHATVSAPSPLASTVVRLDPAIVELGPGYSVGEVFTLAAKIDDVEELAGLGLTIAWNTTYLEYVSHTMTIPVEDHPGGILHRPVIVVVDTVNEVQGTYDCAVAALGGAPFCGSGTAFEITFRVKYQPIAPEPDATFLIKFTLHDLASPVNLIPHSSENCNVTIHAGSPTVRFDPATVELGPDYSVNETFTLKAKIDNFEDLAAFALAINWNTTYLEYVDHVAKIPVEVYSDGILHDPILIVQNDVNISEGWYGLAVAGNGGPSFYGSGIAFEITFRVKYQPQEPESDVNFIVKFIAHEFIPPSGPPIPHSIEHCNMTIHTYPNWNIADVNGDLKVDIFDLLLAVNAYDSTPGESNWNPLVDVAPLWDRVDILDLVTIASHYGEKYS